MKKLNDEHQNDEQDKNSQPIDDSLQQLSDELLDDEVGSYEEDDEAVTEPTNKVWQKKNIDLKFIDLCSRLQWIYRRA